MKHRTASEFTVSVDALVENDRCSLVYIDEGTRTQSVELSRIETYDRQSVGGSLSVGQSKLLVQSMGGEMHIEAEPGKGLRITVALPCIDDDEDSSHRA